MKAISIDAIEAPSGTLSNSLQTVQRMNSPIVELTQGLAAGKEAAFQEFHQQYFERLYRYQVVLNFGDLESAQDAVQETYLRLIRYAKPFEDPEVFWRWLTVLARSAARDGARKNRSHLKMLTQYASDWIARMNPEDTSHESESALLNTLEQSILELDDFDQWLIQSKYFKNKTVRELSEKSGRSLKSIESRLLRARRQLKKNLLSNLNHESE